MSGEVATALLPPVGPRSAEPQRPQELAPLVAAVVVTRDPGPWFDETLASLRDQTYRRLSVAVVDAASVADPTARVGRALPAAQVELAEANPGFGALVNRARLPADAAFLLVCHDDIALEPDAVATMVAEAQRADAGIVGPKLVRWDDPDRLLQVGLQVDRTAVAAASTERGELDQQQCDNGGDVFAVPGACTLVRADLFADLGGFDDRITFHGDDVDLCWRARLAGARVVVAPEARVRHREALGQRRPDDRRRLQHRHRLRTVITCHRRLALLGALARVAVQTVAEVAVALAAGRPSHALDVASAWTWNGRRPLQHMRMRKRVRAVRAVGDGGLRPLQHPGSARLTALRRGQIGRADPRVAAGRRWVATIRADLASPGRRLPLLAASAMTAVALVGSRRLLTGGVPAVGELVAFPSEPWPLLRAWAGGWRPAGLGSEGRAPTAFALLGALGVVGGAMSALRQLLVLGLVPLGAVGAWRMARPLGSQRAGLTAFVVYLAVPVPYNALAGGSWSGLVAYAASPWVVLLLARASGLPPFGPGAGGGRSSTSTRRTLPGGLVVRTLALALVLALAGAIAPAVAGLAALAALGMAVGSLVVGRVRGLHRLLGGATAASALAVVLHLPWTLDLLSRDGDRWAFAWLRPVEAGRGPSIRELVRFDSGAFGGAPSGWAFLVVAALPLVVGRAWRLEWAVRAWFVALGAWGVAWVVARTGSPPGLPAVEVLLAPAAAGLALASACGAASFDDPHLRARTGWRRFSGLVACGAVVVGALPVAAGAVDGRWKMPDGAADDVLAAADTRDGGAPSRVVWLGAPDALPVAGRSLDATSAFATTDHLQPTVADRWPAPNDAASDRLALSLRSALAGDDRRLGRRLAPDGVRYLVAPVTAAPTTAGSPSSRTTTALAEQLDLEPVELSPDLVVYRNTAWTVAEARGRPAAGALGRRHHRVEPIGQAALWCAVGAGLAWARRRRRRSASGAS